VEMLMEETYLLSTMMLHPKLARAIQEDEQQAEKVEGLPFRRS
jgi:PHD/YefM family antitoxin component YafN of YafNO toxin-antitoxin module